MRNAFNQQRRSDYDKRASVHVNTIKLLNRAKGLDLLLPDEWHGGMHYPVPGYRWEGDLRSGLHSTDSKSSKSGVRGRIMNYFHRLMGN